MRKLSTMLNHWHYMSASKLLVGGLLAVAITVTAGTLLYQQPTEQANAATRDHSDNSIIRGGAYSVSELKSDYKNHGRSVKKIFAEFGINSVNDLNGMKNGYVTKSGNVVVDGKTVATNAKSVGRGYMSGSQKVSVTNGTDVWIRDTETSFMQNKLQAFVKFDSNGEFMWAILKACGNPVTATAKPQPKPAYNCTDLQVARVDRDTYRYTAEASAKNGASVSSYTFNFGDGTNKQSKANNSTVTHTYAKPGNYQAKVTAHFKVDGKTVSDNSKACKVATSVKSEPTTEVCNPETGEIITVKESQADSYAPVDSVKCEDDVTVCNPETGEIITVKESQAADYAAKGSVECEDSVQVCNPETGEVISVKESQTDEYAPKDSVKCEDKEAPVVIAETGAAGIFGSATSLGLLGAAGYSFRDSRRRLFSRLLNQ